MGRRRLVPWGHGTVGGPKRCGKGSGCPEGGEERKGTGTTPVGKEFRRGGLVDGGCMHW